MMLNKTFLIQKCASPDNNRKQKCNCELEVDG